MYDYDKLKVGMKLIATKNHESILINEIYEVQRGSHCLIANKPGQINPGWFLNHPTMILCFKIYSKETSAYPKWF